MMKNELSILIVEGNHEEAEQLKILLEKSLLEISSISLVQTLKRAITEIKKIEFDIIFLDLELPDSKGMNTLSGVLKFANETAVVVFSGKEDKEIGLKAVHNGAQDYLVKGLLNSDMLYRIVNYSIKRKQTDRIINNSIQKWESTFNSITDIVAVISKNFTILEINKAGCEAVGMDKTDIIGGKCYELLRGLSAPQEDCPCSRVQVTKQMEITEISEADRSYQLTAWPITIENDEVSTFSLSKRDITERKQAEGKIKGNEEQLQNIFDGITDGFALCDVILDNKGKAKDYRFLRINPAFEKQSGLKVETTIGKTIKEILPDIEQSWIDKYGSVAITGEPIRFSDYNHNTKRHYDVSTFSPSKNRFAMLFKDITKSRETEEKIKENERNLVTAEKMSKIGNWSWDIQTGNVHWSKGTYRIFGVDAKTFSPDIDSIMSHFHPDEREFNKELVANAMENHEPISFESRIILADNRIRNLISISEGTYDKSGKLSTIFGTVQDITDRKKTEEELESQKQRLNNIIEGTHLGTWEWNVQTGETIVNEQWANLIGYTLEEISPVTIDTWIKFAHPDDLEESNTLLNKHFNRELDYYHFESRMKHKDGSWIWVLDRGKVVSWTEDGKPQWMYGTHQDIIERKQNEKSLQESEERYRELVDTLNSGVAIYKVLNDGKYGSDYIIQEFNEFSLQHEHLKKKDVIGKSLKDIRPNIDEYGLIKTFRQVWKTGESAFVPSKMYADNTYSNYYENRVFKLPSGEIVAVYDDVTERENANFKIKVSQERFNLAMKASKDGLFDWNLITNEVYYSPGWKSMLGYSYDELPNELSVLDKLADPSDIKRISILNKKVINKQLERVETDFRMKHKDGHWVNILSRAEVIFDETGKALRLIGTHVDVTERKKIQEEVVLERNLSASIINNLPGVFYLFDISGNFLRWNRNFEKISGYSTEEFSKLSPLDLFQGDDKKTIEAKIKEVFRKGISVAEARINTKNGELIPYHFTGTLVDYNEEKCLIGVGTDITERKLAELELWQSETMLIASQKIAKVGGWEFDLKDQIIYWTEETYRIHDFDPGQYPQSLQEHISRSVECYKPEDQKMIMLAFNKCVEKGIQYDMEVPFTSTKGRELWVRTSAIPIYEDGKIVKVNGTLQDITERKQIEEALRENKEKFEILSNVTFEGILIHDKGVPISMNQSFANMFGYLREELTNKELIPLLTKKEFHDVIYRNIKNEYTLPYDIIGIRKDGTEFPIEIEGKTHIDENKKRLRVTALRDVTQRKKSEKKLRESESQLKKAQTQGKMGNWKIDLNNGMVSGSGETFRIYGLESDEPISAVEVQNIHLPEYRSMLDEKIEKLIKGEESYNIEFELKKVNNGEIITVHSIAEYNSVDNTINGTIQDVTERKKTEEAIQKNEEQLRNIFDNITNMYYSHDTEHVINYVSPQVLEILGYTQKEAMENWTNFASDNPINEIGYKKTVEAIKTGKRQPIYELELVRKDGKKIIVEVRESPILKDGKTVAIVGSLNDITERKLAEESLKNRMQELELFNKTSVGRELNMIELKKEINELLQKSGKDAKYKIAE